MGPKLIFGVLGCHSEIHNKNGVTRHYYEVGLSYRIRLFLETSYRPNTCNHIL